jgi:AraC-like DNA-binding protein
LRRLRLAPKDLAAADLAVRELELEQKEARPGKAAATRLLFQRLLLQLARLGGSHPGEPDGKHAAPAGLAAARALLHAQPQGEHSLSSLAKVAGLSPSHFRRLFRRSYGDSPIQLLIRQRVHNACGPLESSDLTITEVAYQCGFKDGNYFSRQFKQVMGTSPAEYRRLFRQG